METTLKSKVYQSRWGFHPCSYEIFLKLKKLNGLYFKALQMRGEWERWDRKEPQNRVICKTKRDELGRKIGKEIVGPRLEPNIDNIFLKKQHVNSRWYGEYDIVAISGIDIMKEYQKAKKPRKEDEVEQLTITEQGINELYEQII